MLALPAPVARVLTTTPILKMALAVSGAGWFFFLLNHLYSNLHVFAGRDALNDYYEHLKESPAMLWGIRGVLLAGFVVHVGTALVFVRRAMKARSVGYRVSAPQVTTYAARTMKITGPLVGLYLVYHLAHFTAGVAMPAGTMHDAHDVYGNMVASFQVPWVAAVYVIANSMLTLHLAHGAKSLLQTLGLKHPSYDAWVGPLVMGLALAMCAGFVAIPAAIALGLVR